MLLHPSGWLTSHHKHLSNPQLSCEEPGRHEDANEEKEAGTEKPEAGAEESETEAEEAEKPREL